jgi:hypothetical protein
VYCTSPTSFRLWAELFDRADSSVSKILGPEDSSLSIPSIFHLLHEVAEYRKLLLKVFYSAISYLCSYSIITQFLTELILITQLRIAGSIAIDDVEIALMLQRLVQDKSYRHELPTVPEDEAFSVLNLTHHASYFNFFDI